MASKAEKGLELIEKKFFKQAILELKKALGDDAEEVYEQIIERFGSYLNSEKYEESLVLGKIALDHQPDNYKLANDLGNCARKTEDYEQAENLYNRSLRIKKDFSSAILNLAACQVRIDKYDADIEKMIGRYLENDRFLLPEGIEVDEEDQRTLFNYIRELDHIQKEQVLLLEKEIHTQSGELEKVKVIEDQLDQLSANSDLDKIDQEVIDSLLKKMSKEKWESFSKKEKAGLQKATLNSGIAALQKNDGEFAKSCFDRIHGNSGFAYFDMLVALTNYLTGETRAAFSAFEDLISKFPENRYLNINFGLLHHKENSTLKAYRFLLKGAFFLEKLDGIHKTSEIRKAAAESYQKGLQDKALVFYEAIKKETSRESDWMNLGKLYHQKDNLEEACFAFNKVLKMNSASSEASEMLNRIHDSFFNAGEEEYEENKFEDAVKNYECALTAIRKPETLIKASKAYDHMGDKNSCFALKNEYNEAVVRLRLEKKLELRRQHMKNGKAAIQQKDINKAIKCFEDAMTLKVDREAVEYLVKIYKSLNRTQALHKVTTRWNIEKKLQAKIKSSGQ